MIVVGRKEARETWERGTRWGKETVKGVDVIAGKDAKLGKSKTGK